MELKESKCRRPNGPIGLARAPERKAFTLPGEIATSVTAQFASVRVASGVVVSCLAVDATVVELPASLFARNSPAILPRTKTVKGYGKSLRVVTLPTASSDGEVDRPLSGQ